MPVGEEKFTEGLVEENVNRCHGLVPPKMLESVVAKQMSSIFKMRAF